MSGAARITLAVVATLAIGCATPVGVKRADMRTVHRSLGTNVLSHGQPSAPSVQVLHRLALSERFRDDPEATLAELHARLPAQDVGGHLFALAELSFLHAERSGDRTFFLAAAVYAYAFLFPETEDAPPASFDPRARLAADLYNRGITAGLPSADGETVRLEAGRYALPFGELEIEVDPSGFRWGDHELVRFTPAAELEVRGLRNRYRQPGIGAPMAAGARPWDPTIPDQGAVRIPQRVKVPVTVFLRFAEPRRGIAEGQLRGTLELYTRDVAGWIEVGGREIPLEYEPSASLAYALHESPIWQFEIRGFLSGEFRGFEDGLYMLHPYVPGRVPVVLVHGTASSPARWAEMLNELASDPSFEERYQYWFFLYNTGNPILYTAALLRRALRDAVVELDPAGRDPALRRMVLIGHSQGGLIARLMVVDSGDRFWSQFSRKPLDALDLSPETHDLLDRAFFFEPVPSVERVIFIATPHRGSFLAGRRLGRLAAGLVTMPVNVARTGRELLERNSDAAVLRSLDDLPSSVDNMDPSAPFVRTLGETRLADGVKAHSIIPVRGKGPLPTLNDGVVEYTSAHLKGVASELVVRSGHSTQSHPDTIEETRRILHEHLEEP